MTKLGKVIFVIGLVLFVIGLLNQYSISKNPYGIQMSIKNPNDFGGGFIKILSPSRESDISGWQLESVSSGEVIVFPEGTRLRQHESIYFTNHESAIDYPRDNQYYWDFQLGEYRLYDNTGRLIVKRTVR